MGCQQAGAARAAASPVMSLVRGSVPWWPDGGDGPLPGSRTSDGDGQFALGGCRLPVRYLDTSPVPRTRLTAAPTIADCSQLP